MNRSCAPSHYAEHNVRNLDDAEGLVGNTWAVITADGNISGSELQRLLKDAGDLYQALHRIYEDREKLVLAKPLLDRLKLASWAEALEPLRLPVPAQETIADWMNHAPDWIGGAMSALTQLRSAALEELLVVEKRPGGARTGRSDSARRPGSECVASRLSGAPHRPGAQAQTKLNWWDSFQTASGIILPPCASVSPLPSSWERSGLRFRDERSQGDFTCQFPDRFQPPASRQLLPC